jgi:hypothetical protein
MTYNKHYEETARRVSERPGRDGDGEPAQFINVPGGYIRPVMVSDTEPAAEAIRRLYERYQAADSDEERREIALEMGALDRRRHADIYAALEDE